MDKDLIAQIAEKTIQPLRDDYPGVGANGWMWTDVDLHNPEELYYSQEHSLRHLMPMGGLSSAEEKVLFEELQRLVTIELELQEAGLEDGTALWLDMFEKGEPLPVDDGHPLTRKSFSRLRSILTPDQLHALDVAETETS